MFRYTLVFYAIALVSAVLAFGGIAAGMEVIAQAVFGVCLTLAIVTLFLGLMRKGV
jgi:uncharacterized membrane protein YtjA (UPF0391 family)